MKALLRSLVLMASAALLAPGAASAQNPNVPPTTDGCTGEGQLRFVCGQAGPEDLIAVPGTPWVIASSYWKEGLKLIDRRTETSTALFPAASAATAFDARTYAGCPGPLSANDLAGMNTHGLALQRRKSGDYTLYAVHHGDRESVEVFTLHLSGGAPRVTWIGCVVAPMPLGINSLVPLPDGGFITSHFRARGPGAAESRELSEAGKVNGELYEWHPGGGFAKVPLSEASGANGIELSRDGKWIYFAAWGSRSIEAVSRGRRPVRRASVPLGFRLDNIRLGADGQIYGAGQPDDGGVRVIRVDPRTFKVTTLLSLPRTARFGFATGAILIGREVWVASAYGDRVAIFTPGR